MQLEVTSHTLQGNSDLPHSRLERIAMTPLAENSQEIVFLQFLREQPELLVFTLADVEGEWRLKKTK